MKAPLDAIRSPDGSHSPISAVARVRRIVALEHEDVWSLVVYSGAVGLLSLAVPIGAQAIVNTVAFTALPQQIFVLASLVLVGLGLAALLRIARLQTIEQLQERIMVRATHDAVLRVTRARITAFDEHGAPELMNRFFDVMTVQKASSTLLVDALSTLLQATVSLLLLAFYHPALLAFDVVLVLLIVFVIFGLGRRGVATSIDESATKYEIAAWLEDVASSVRGFKAPAASKFAFQRSDELAEKYVFARRRHFKILRRQAIGTYVLQILATAGLLGLGGMLVINGELTLGQLVAAELIVASVTTGLVKLDKQLESFYDLAASFDKLGYIVDLEEERGGRVRSRAKASGSLRFDDVTYRHGDGSHALRGVSFETGDGLDLAVLGADSSGKSTLADLAFGLLFPSDGRITLDGVDSRDLALDDLRRDVAVVGRSEVFEGDVLENVFMGRSYEQADVVAPLRVTGLDRDVAALPEGLSTHLGHGGSRLTSSQRARLMLARAVARKPRFLVIDAALDGLADSTIDVVLGELARLEERPALLVLTSRDDVARRFARVARLEDGSLTFAEDRP